MECLKRAVELDPAFAVAWAGLADAYTVQGYWGMAPPGEVMPKALTAARRAVALDPQLGEGHCALGAALMLWEHDYEGAKRAFQRGLELNPQHIQGRTWYGLFVLQWVGGQLQEGVAELRRAYDDDPLSAYAATMLGFGLATAGETEEGLRFVRLATERDPEALVGHWTHGLVAQWHGAFDESLAAFARACEVSSRAEYPLVQMTAAYAACGRMAEARALHDELLSRRARGYVTYLGLAMVSAAVGDMDAAMEYAQQSCDEREPAMVIFARLFPNMRRLRADPRFADVLRRLALPTDDQL